jgi:FAD/FMN-containing dehydrogenase
VRAPPSNVAWRTVSDPGRRLPADALDELRAIVGDDHVLVDAERLVPMSTDWTGRFVGRAAAAVRPASTGEVAAVVGWARRRGAALMTQGGNTGLVGGATPLHGEVLVSTSRLNSVTVVDMASMQVTVGAGVTIEAVQQHAERAGLRYPIDFAARATATVGGSIATNAGGVNFVRFGGTREQLLGVEAVLGTGEVINDLRGLRKDNTGFHLASLLCGSEGTLAVVTGATLRLVPRPAAVLTALVGFDSAHSAIAAGHLWVARSTRIEALELMRADGVGLVCEQFALPTPLRAAAYLLVEVAGERDLDEELHELVECTDGVTGSAVAADESARRRLWRYREDHTLAINRLGPPLKFDITLPGAEMQPFVDSIASQVRGVDDEANTWIFGHLGDGNLHVNVHATTDAAGRIESLVFTEVSRRGGSISAEHGIGVAKRAFLHLRRSPAELAWMGRVRAAFDPDGVLNPHVLLPHE